MKVELQCGDTIDIPKDCTVQIENNKLIIKEKAKIFKDGDILIDKDKNFMVIFKKYGDDKSTSTFYSYYSNYKEPLNYWFTSYFNYATEEEKQSFFNELKAKGLKWNAEEKRVEKIRWRAGVNEKYFSFDSALRAQQFVEDNDTYDNAVYDALNYFRTKEQNEEAARRVKKTLRKYHEELGY